MSEFFKSDYNETKKAQFERDVDAVLKDIGDLLKKKNASYGDSVLDPVRIFSKASPTEQLRVRIDDKLSRLARGEPGLIKEDVVKDLIGYLIIDQIAALRAVRAEKGWNPAG